MWFWFSIITLVFWSGSDLFSKIGCRSKKDPYSHLKMVMAVGVVMGLHAMYEIFVGGTMITAEIILTYLPVSILYIVSMAMGYMGLKYIELSVSSPICNSSGALVAIMVLLTAGIGDTGMGQLIAVIFVCIGVIGLGVVEYREDSQLRANRQLSSNYKYAKSFKAFMFPIAYCILDAAGTFADSAVIGKIEGLGGVAEKASATGAVLSDVAAGSANVAYELTFLFAAILCFVYVVLIKKQKLLPKMEGPKYIGAVCETIGQFTYIFAISDSEHLMLSAPIISAYCVGSVIWGRIFLKEKLSWKHYAMIGCVVAGIVILGIIDP